MIAVDISGTIFSGIYVSLTKDKTDTVSEDFLRYIILNSIKSINHKFSPKYGKMVLCGEGKNNWRKDLYPSYKANRKFETKPGGPNWGEIFQSVRTIVQEIVDNLPYRYIAVPHAEADDCIGVIARRFLDIRVDKNDKLLIVSNDKDFGQLQRYPYVAQYKPMKGTMYREPNPEMCLLTLICKGDKIDNVPNIKSPIDAFITGTRQSPIRTTFIQEIYNTKGKCLSMSERRRFRENRELIDLDMTPKQIENDVLEAFKEPLNKVTSLTLMEYFASHGLKKFAESPDDFKN